MALDLGAKVGPLPMGAWIGAGAAGVGFTVWRARKNAATSQTPVSNVADGTGGYSSVGTGPGTPGWLSTAPPSTPTTTSLSTNVEWAQAVQRDLLAKNYDPILIDAMIRDVLAANPLSVSENALYAVALVDIGPLPEVLPPTGPPPGPTTPAGSVFVSQAAWDTFTNQIKKLTGRLNAPPSTYTGPMPSPSPASPTTGGVLVTQTDLNALGAYASWLAAHQKVTVPNMAQTAVTPATPPPATPSAPAQVSQRTVTVTQWPSQDSTLSGIAQHYGVAGGWQAIYNANRNKISNPNVIHAGQVLVLP